MRPSVDGLILAGGGSTRFGREKLLYPVEGRPMISRVFEALAPAVDRVWISVAAQRDDLPVEATQVVDPVPDAGPLAGIRAGLAATSAEALLVVAGDMPYLRVPLLRRLRATFDSSRGIVVASTPDERPQPLCAVYPRSLLARVDQLLSDDQRAVHTLLRGDLPVAIVEAPAEYLRNINSRLDLLPLSGLLYY